MEFLSLKKCYATCCSTLPAKSAVRVTFVRASLLLLLGVFGVVKWNIIRDQSPVGKVAEPQKGSQAKGPSRGYAREEGRYID